MRWKTVALSDHVKAVNQGQGLFRKRARRKHHKKTDENNRNTLQERGNIMSLNYNPDHLYLKVIDDIKQKITSGVFKEKEKLPSEFQLSKLLNTPRETIREALNVLEEENIIINRHGVGTYVNPRPI